MKQFQVKPVVHWFDHFDEFVSHFCFTTTDCIFTVHALYKEWLEPLNLNSSVILYEDYGEGEPTDEMIDSIMTDFHRLNCQRLIALGGGSVLDIAKLLALKATAGTTVDMFEGRAELVKDKELILIPTTCGTGSEMTCISITGIPSKSTKKGLADTSLFADIAVLVPELLYELPKHVMVTSSLDALIHAMESFVAPKAHAYSDLFSSEAVRLLIRSYKTLITANNDNVVKVIAGDLLRASNYAGIAFSNTGVGAVHALAYPLGEKYHVFHGEACARFYHAVFQLYRSKQPEGKIRLLTQLLTQALDFSDKADSCEILDVLLGRLLPRKPLRNYGMKEADIELFADSVIHEQQRLLVNNYVPLNRDEIRDIYKKLW